MSCVLGMGGARSYFGSIFTQVLMGCCAAVDKRLDEWVSQDRLVQLNGCTQMDVLTPRMASLPILPQCVAFSLD